MECPACAHGLTEITQSDVKVDVCKGGCGGIWFDQLEIIKFDEAEEHAGAELLNVETNPNRKVDHKRRRDCPRCTGQIMMRHRFSPGTGVEVDQCPACAGFWLDAGELGGIRGAHVDEGARRQAALAHFDELFAKDLDRARAEVPESLGSRLETLFMWLSPSGFHR
jgi:Zn-finger nucleic acid-binding protein